MKASALAITGMGASEIARAIAKGELTAREAVDAHIAQIEEVNPRLNAVVVPLFDEARESAKAADLTPAATRGLLHGVPVTIKECYDVKGTASTAGVPSRKEHCAEADAPLVARLRRAGAIILGKTNLSQLLMYVETDNPVFGMTRNPWNPDRSSGGSSGGEGAIVAARGSALGLGTDVGGSVRVPAHCCGICSIKPTSGRLTTEGTVPVNSDICNAGIPDSGGFLARQVQDLRLALSAVSPPEIPRSPLEGIRIGFYDDDGYFPASAPLRRAVREAAEALRQRGCFVAPFAPPDIYEGMALFAGFFGADRGATWSKALAGGPVDPRMKELISLAGAPNMLRPLIGTVFNLAGQPHLAHAVRLRTRPDSESVAALTRGREAYRSRFAAAMVATEVDVLLAPPNSVAAFRHGATKDLGFASVNYTALYNLLGYPAGVVTTTSVRAGETSDRPRSREKMMKMARANDEGSDGLPVGVQVIAGPGREDRVLSVMEALERSSTWHPPT